MNISSFLAGFALYQSLLAAILHYLLGKMNILKRKQIWLAR